MVVIDVNAAVDAVRDGTKSPVYNFLMKSGEKAIAPEFFGIEAAQVAWKYARVAQLEEPAAKDMLNGTISYVSRFYDDAELIGEALSEAIRNNHSVYDMLYFVLARRTSSTLLTCDRRLAAVCKSNGVDCLEVVDL